MKTILLAVSVVALASSVNLRAQVVETPSSSNVVPITDRTLNTNPFTVESDTIVVSGSGIASLTDVNVLLSIQATWNGDYKVSLTHVDTGHTAVLLNRAGLDRADGNDVVTGDSESTFGYSDNGFSKNTAGTVVGVFRLDDQAANDVHFYRHILNGTATSSNDGVPLGALVPVTGNWQPDGRTASGDAVTAGDARPALLAVFNGESPNGTWRLDMSDHSAGDSGSLQTWTLELTGTAVPEPSTYAVIFGGFSFLGVVALRKFRKQATVSMLS